LSFGFFLSLFADCSGKKLEKRGFFLLIFLVLKDEVKKLLNEKGGGRMAGSVVSGSNLYS
jgi:hypothetical protein